MAMRKRAINKFSVLALVLALTTWGFATFGPEKEASKIGSEFLSQASTIIREDPTDGRFGIARMPTLHGRTSFDGDNPAQKGVIEAWNLLAKDYYLALVSWGNFNEAGNPSRMTTMSAHYQLSYSPLNDSEAANKAQMKLMQEVGPEGAAKLMKSGKKSSESKMDYAGKEAIIQYRSVYPSSDKCLGCHANVAKGKPIGVLALVRIKK